MQEPFPGLSELNPDNEVLRALKRTDAEPVLRENLIRLAVVDFLTFRGEPRRMASGP